MKTSKWITSAMAAAFVFTAGAAIADDKSDWAVTKDVKLALLAKLGADALHIDVETKGGDVNLLGKVNKRETKELASTIAQSVKGVHAIDNDLELAATVANSDKVGAAVGEAEAEVKDAMMESTVRWALLDKLGSEGTKVGTEAASGVITLEFHKDWPAAKRQEAVAAVKGLDGVVKVLTIEKKS
ncbi:MAG: BON domain-containing protein [Thermoanaerobaculia bacterium]